MRFDRGDISEIVLFPRDRFVRFIANSMPRRLVMFLPTARSSPNVSMSARVMASAGALLSASAIAARRFGSGMSTTCTGTCADTLPGTPINHTDSTLKSRKKVTERNPTRGLTPFRQWKIFSIIQIPLFMRREALAPMAVLIYL